MAQVSMASKGGCGNAVAGEQGEKMGVMGDWSAEERTSVVRVLLVEDDPAAAQTLRAMLAAAQGSNFDIACVERLESALERVRAEWPDAVLLDLSLPDSQGLHGVTRLRSAAPHLPIIVLTGQSDPELARDAFRAGVKDYVVKDNATAAVLLRSLRYALERQNLEDSLRELQADWRALVDAISDPVFRLSDQGAVELLNADSPNHSEFMGMKRLEEVISADTAAALLRRLRSGLLEGEQVSLACGVLSRRTGGSAVARMARRGNSTIVVLRRPEREAGSA
jgi:DNA-binding NarL/FixJ family response regulator